MLETAAQQRIFVSYASPDRQTAQAAVDALEHAGIPCWIAPRDISVGSDWSAEISGAIDRCGALLLVLSEHSNASRQVAHEVHVAHAAAKPILPYRIDTVEPSGALRYLLSGVHRVDAPPGEPKYAVLAERIRAHFAASESRRVSGGAAAPPVRPNNLPRSLTSFVGRSAELAQLEPLIETERLITVVGTGGGGKTRITLEAARAVLDAFVDGAWLVELAPVDASLVAGAFAQALGVTLPPSGDAFDAIARAAEARQMLIVVDNCEHVVEAAAAGIAVLVQRCPGVRVLASSRQPLSIAGERIYRLPVLAEAKELFVERARSAGATLTLDAEEESTVAQICARLDDVPLAIELAAARAAHVTPRKLLAMLDERFSLLTSGGRDRLERQQTLYALIDWSYELLSERERTFFRRLGVFAASFSLEAAAEICCREDLPSGDTLSILASLIDKSLIVADLEEREARYRLLESVRAFACSQLARCHELEAIRDAHLTFVRDLFCDVERSYAASTGEDDLARIAPELDDARSAIDWALASERPGEAADVFLATRLWDYLGLYREAIEAAKRIAAALPEADVGRQAALCERRALALARTGDYANAATIAAAAVEQSRRCGGAVLSDALVIFGDVLSQTASGFEQARGALDEAERLGQQTPRRRLQILDARGLIALSEGDLENASQIYETIREIYRAARNARGELTAILNLAEIEHQRGDARHAARLLQEQLPNAERLPDAGAIVGNMLLNLAGYLAAAEDAAGARSAALRAIALEGSRQPDGIYVAIAIEHLALALALQGDYSRAACFESYVQNRFEALGFERSFTEHTTYRKLTSLLNAEVPAASLQRYRTQGEFLKPSAAIAEATSLDVRDDSLGVTRAVGNGNDARA